MSSRLILTWEGSDAASNLLVSATKALIPTRSRLPSPRRPNVRILINEFACPLAGTPNSGEVSRRLRTRPDRSIGHFRITQDCPNDIVEIMGYPT